MEPVIFSEIVGPPAGGRVYEEKFRAGFADCAPSGRVRLDALARWLQDVAYGDVDDAGLAQAAVWVVRRTRMVVRRFPRFAERYTARTFCSGMGRMWAERRTTFTADGVAGDVEAVSLWVHLDPASWRPAPFTPQEVKTYGSSAGGRRVTARLRHPGPSSQDRAMRWRFRATELDIAGHINNAAYWTPLEEQLLLEGEPQTIDVELEYRSPIQPGEMLVIRQGERSWIVAEDGEWHASAIIAG